MHYHAEIWIPVKENVEQQISTIMARYNETTNDDGFYDWYNIGGRWTGVHDSYDPTKDENNYTTCWLCNGTGDRPGWVNYDINNVRRFTTAWSETVNGCNGCLGTGKMLKHPSNFVRHEQDIIPVSEITDGLMTYTLIVNDKVFHDAESFNGESFDGNVKKQLKKLGIKDGYVVTIDYHN